MPFKDLDKAREYRKLYYREWRKKNYQYKVRRTTEEKIMVNRIGNWKQMGLICDDYEKLYDKFINTEFCELCNVKLTDESKVSNTKRCLDHDHKTGLFRNVVCKCCNGKTDLRCRKDNKLQIKNITEYKNGYMFRKTIDKKVHAKCFKTLEEAIEYRDNFKI